MKTLNFWGMTLLMVMLTVSFTACSDDDEPLDLNSLEGTWMLAHSKGWELCSNYPEKDEWDKDFNNLNSNSEVIKIIEISENKYSFFFGYYTGSDWHTDSSTTGTFNGKTVELKDSPYYSNPVIESLTSDRMVVRITYNEVFTGEEGHYHSGDIINTYIKK